MRLCGTDKSLPAVPRSKGCLTCVSCKARCGPSRRKPGTSLNSDLVADGKRLTCCACENRKQPCGGYRREEVVFLSEGWRALGVASAARSKIRKPNRTKQSELRSSDSPTPTCSESDKSDKSEADLVLYPRPAMDRSHLHIAFFLASFGTRPFQSSRLHRPSLPPLPPLGFLHRTRRPSMLFVAKHTCRLCGRCSGS